MTNKYKSIEALIGIDAYKLFHHKAYAHGTTRVNVNLTARSGKLSNIVGFDEGVVFVGLQGYIKEYLQGKWQTFFDSPIEQVSKEMKEFATAVLGKDYDVSHIEKLHAHGKMPLVIRALPEGSLVPYKVPMLTVENTVDDFYWLPNFIETQMSAYLWGMITSATTAFQYRKVFDKYAKKTGYWQGLPQFQAHDFSARGLIGQDAQRLVGAGHLFSSAGTDTLPAIDYMVQNYNADVTKELVGCSVDATEHSVMCSWEQHNEQDLLKHLITEVTPTGIVSIVSDTWDLWRVVTEYLPNLKSDIESREGDMSKVVIRPDSGCPVKILCGDPDAKTEHEKKGLWECLWDIFGGTVNEKGFKELNPKIGAIYGDSITLERQSAILQQLTDKGFAPTLVLGVGSYSYQYVTRDTHGMAFKATNITKDGKEVAIFKDPATDDGTKKSAKGLISVYLGLGGEFYYQDEQTRENYESDDNALQVVYKDGSLVKETSLEEVRELVQQWSDDL